MTENLLLNGEIAGNLYYWSGTGTIERTLGYPRAGCVKLAAGQTIQQVMGISANNLYTLHYFYRLATGATLTAGYGTVTHAHAGAPSDTWREGVFSFALDISENSAVTFSVSGGTAYVDTITLMYESLPSTRGYLASMIAASLRTLASDAGLSGAATGDKPEGDYTLSIDEALRSLGAMGEYGDPDVTMLEAGQINDAVEAGKRSILQILRSDYALKTDVTLGPRSENYSQIAPSIDSMLDGAAGNRRVTMGKLTHEDWRR